MFCKNCGKEISDNAVVCPNCGVATDNMEKTSAPVHAQDNTMALVGFILSLLGFNVIALVLSIIGLQNSRKPEYAGNGKGFAIAGIVISSAYVALCVLIVVIVIGVTGCAIGCGSYYY